MKFETKVFLTRQKYYFDLGLATTSLIKYFLVLVGVAELINGLPYWITFVGLFAYALSCYGLGYVMVYYDFVTASHEVNNRLNNFMVEVREKLK